MALQPCELVVVQPEMMTHFMQQCTPDFLGKLTLRTTMCEERTSKDGDLIGHGKVVNAAARRQWPPSIDSEDLGPPVVTIRVNVIRPR